MIDTAAMEAAISEFTAAGWARIGAATDAELRQVEATAARRYWSGPTRLERKIMRRFGITHQQITLIPPSFLDGKYRTRQRNRRRRRDGP